MQAHQPRSVSRWHWLAAIPLLLFTACSQGTPLNLVQGKVLDKDQPLKGVLVTFHPKGGSDMNSVLPTGLTGDDGVFSVTTGDAPGAPTGEYVLTLICSEEVAAPAGKKMSMGMGPEFEDRFKGAYANSLSSKIQVEIKPGPNQLDPIRLK